MRALLLLLVAPCVIAYCPAFMDGDTTCSCYPYVDGAIIKCDGPEGPAMVEKLKSAQTEIRELSLMNANIIEIGPRAFRNLRIKSLKLDNNRIKAIHPDAFRGLENSLTSLSITHNKLTEIPTDALLGMNQLTVLDLQCNSIGDIYGISFRNVSRLIELNLACNQICKIDGPAFATVKHTMQSLILDNNCLKEIPADALRGFDSLLALHVQYNQIVKLDKLQLMNLDSLLMLKLTGNKISSIDRHALTNVPNLRYLFLDRNDLHGVDPGIFQQFKVLEIIDLSYNNIAEVTADAFKGITRLMQLNLEGNVIKDIAPSAFSNTPLLLLMLGKNCLTTITPHMFQGIPFLRQLSIPKNNIRLIQPFTFQHLPNLHMLDLSGNKIQVVQPNALSASPQVTIMLQENPMVCAQEGYHIVQGGQAIHLLNEANAVCDTDYTSTDVADDTCPTRDALPAPPACCAPRKTVVRTRPPTTTTQSVFIEKVTQKPTTTIRRTQRPITLRRTTPNPSVNGQTTRRSRSRINMERFWRLAGIKTSKGRTAPSRRVSTPSVRRIDTTRGAASTLRRGSPTPPPTTTTRRPLQRTFNLPAPTRRIVPSGAAAPAFDPFAGHRGPFLPDSGLPVGPRTGAQAPGTNGPPGSVDRATTRSSFNVASPPAASALPGNDFEPQLPRWIVTSDSHGRQAGRDVEIGFGGGSGSIPVATGIRKSFGVGLRSQ